MPAAPFPATQVIYIRHPKSASSSILCHFNGCRRHGAAPIDVTDDPLSFQELHGVAHVRRGARQGEGGVTVVAAWTAPLGSVQL